MIDIKYWGLLQASKALIAKIDKITKSEEYKSVFTLAHVHGLPYEGEEWWNEYQELKSVIRELEKNG